MHGRSQEGLMKQLKIPIKKIYDVTDQGKNKNITCEENITFPTKTTSHDEV